MTSKEEVLFFLVLVIVLASVFGSIGAGYGRHTEREKAIEANVAKWTVDAKTGERNFVYGVQNEAKE